MSVSERERDCVSVKERERECVCVGKRERERLCVVWECQLEIFLKSVY